MKLATRSAALALGIACLLTTGLPAQAEELPSDQPQGQASITLTDEQRNDILSRFASYDVDPAQAEALVEALEDGEPWDSQTDAPPVSVTHESRDGFDFTVSRWADGSYVAVGIEQPASSTARAISGCATSGTSAGVAYKTNCTIRVDTASTSGQFKASMSYWSSGSSIYDVGDGWVNWDLGEPGAGNFSSSTAPGTKWTQYNWQSNIDGWWSSTRYVRLTVSTTGTLTSANY